MYLNHFGLKKPPFKITPDTTLFFSGSQRGAILEAMVYAISSGEGIIKLVSEVGSGKTMTCRMLELSLPDNIEVVYLANPSLSPENILFAIAFELRLAIDKNSDKLDVMQHLQNYLLEKHSKGIKVVVFVEEAQCMPLETLEEIRLLTNLETTEDKLLQIVLFGQPELDDKLAQVSIRQLRERISQNFFLRPFNSKETYQYLNFRMATVGYRGPEIFSLKIAKIIHKNTLGLTRKINLLADKSMLAAFANNHHKITPKDVKMAIIDNNGHYYGQNTQHHKTQGKSSLFKWFLAILLSLYLILFIILNKQELRLILLNLLDAQTRETATIVTKTKVTKTDVSDTKANNVKVRKAETNDVKRTIIPSNNTQQKIASSNKIPVLPPQSSKLKQASVKKEIAEPKLKIAEKTQALTQSPTTKQQTKKQTKIKMLQIPAITALINEENETKKTLKIVADLVDKTELMPDYPLIKKLLKANKHRYATISSSFYSIQIFSAFAGEEARIESFIKKMLQQLSIGEFYLIKTSNGKKDRQMYALEYGIYNNKKAAELAYKTLPEKLIKRYKPYIKKKQITNNK